MDEIKCYECEGVMSPQDQREGVSKTPYGSSSDYEPPDNDYIHKACWEALSEERKEGIRVGSWARPHWVEGGNLA